MKNKPITESLSELNVVIKSFIKAHADLLKVKLLEKVTKSGTYFLTVILGVVIAASILLLLTFAFSFWYGEVMGNIYEGFLISAGFILFLGVLLYLLRHQIFTNNIIRNIGNILFNEEDEEH